MKAVIKRQDIPGLVIMFIIGLGLTSLGIIKVRNAAGAKKWPVTTGTVTNSEVGGAVKYYPSVTYSYTVDNAVYASNSISSMNFNSKNRNTVEEFLKKYPKGSEVKVYYNSLEPSKAFLEPGINNGHILLLAFGIGLIALPVFLVSFIKVDLRKNPGTPQ